MFFGQWRESLKSKDKSRWFFFLFGSFHELFWFQTCLLIVSHVLSWMNGFLILPKPTSHTHLSKQKEDQEVCYSSDNGWSRFAPKIQVTTNLFKQRMGQVHFPIIFVFENKISIFLGPWRFLPWVHALDDFLLFFGFQFPLLPARVEFLMIMVGHWWNDVSWMIFVLVIYESMANLRHWIF